jgi:hypothetical protein
MVSTIIDLIHVHAQWCSIGVLPLTNEDIEQAALQHLKQQGKKDIENVHHIELINASEVDALIFKRPLFDKDLTLSVMVPQNLLGGGASMPRAGSFNSDTKTNSGGFNLSFGKSHKHKHENVEQTKLFALEKTLRRDLDAFCKVFTFSKYLLSRSSY